MINNNDEKIINNDSKGALSFDHMRKLFVGGLSTVTTEDSLRKFYSQWGEVVDAVVMRDPNTKRSRCFGFITYNDANMVDKAQAARPHIIDAKAVDSKRALPRPDLSKNEANASVKKIFVGGLKENHDEVALSNYFSQFGKVVGVKILADKNTGRKRGFAFVEFDDYDSVDKVVLQKNHTINYVLVDVKKSVYKQEFAKKIRQNVNGIKMEPNLARNGSMVTYPQPTGSYNTHPTYAYPPQATPAIPSHNGWASYASYPSSAIAGYGAYNTTAPQGGWNATAYAATSWNQNGYTLPPHMMTGSPSMNMPPNTWSHPNASQPFGDYQQSYNRGPQKAGNLQGNRVNPYNVAPVANYGPDPVHGYYSKPFAQAGGHYNVMRQIRIEN